MFLKRLELQGFKTFAGKTEFVFESGITAIVGPNGSGKSNIADAVRWVLGEQSSRPLRIKRSDDVIFAGSSTRPRVGMAEVSVTVDNATKWLPVDFSEVTITRRAYRSGESEYLINKSRVRLRDVVEMLLAGNVGQNNYTVIGQGAIDAALSLRPEERRTLFEEAADIKRYQIKRNDALGKLQTTEANLVRIRDLLAEIAPRLQSLQNQAQRAQVQQRLLQEMRAYLAAWYAQRWNEASEDLRRSVSAETEAQRTLDEAEAVLTTLGTKLAALRQRESEMRAQLGDWHRQSSALHIEAEGLERRMAVGRASLDATSRQRRELLDEVVPLHEQLAAQQQTVAAAEADAAALAVEQRARLDALAQLEQEAAQLEARRLSIQQQIAQAEADMVSAAAALASAVSGLSSMAGRRQALQQDIARRRTQIAERQSSVLALQQTISELRAGLDTHNASIAAEEAQRAAGQAAMSEARQVHIAAGAALTTAREERRALELRLDALSRLHESLAGYDAGVRSVLNAQRAGKLSGVVGTVASLLRAPAQYEAAISAALGSHEQDIVTESWAAAEAAVEHLRQTRGGRATFLPLDAIQGREAPTHAGDAIGRAVDVVEFAERFRPVAAYLLGRALLARDLAAARRILAQPAMRSVSSIVTLAGDIVRPGGPITGGSPSVRSSGLLERERELVDLPAHIQAAKTKEAALEQKLAAAQSSLRQAEERLVALEGRTASLRRTRDEQNSLVMQRQREHEQWLREVAWEKEQERRLVDSLAGLDAEEKKLAGDVDLHRRRQAEAQSSIAALRQSLAEMAGSELAGRLAQARTAAALGDQDLKTRQESLASRRQDSVRLAAQIAAKEKRAGELADEIAHSGDDVEAARVTLRSLSAAISAMNERIAPAEAGMDALEQERSALMDSELQARNRHAMLERAHSQAAIEVQRSRNDIGKLQAQIESEEGLGVESLGLEEEDVRRLLHELAVPVQLSLTAPEARAPLDQQPAASPELLKRRVDSLRSQIRHLGPVNPNAVTEYEETLQRFTFLTTQSDDLDKAVKSLRTVIVELDELMRSRFETTFQAVALEFRRFFSTLFGGGTARLTLTDPDDLAETGIEIVAQPPGKRLQSLALLSGGERALAGTALLFALITVNPTPFCVLDEVDAALDDANVGRFRDALRTLAEHTQFIVITHNKGTMEIASALYGISMSSDSTSQVLSLKLEDIPVA